MHLVEIDCESKDGIMTTHHLIVNDNSIGTVIILSGANNITDRPPLHLTRKVLLDRGYNVLNINYTGILNGKPNEKAIKNITYVAKATLKKAMNHSEVSDVIVVGRSLGSVVASELLKELEETKMVVIMSPVNSTIEALKKIEVNKGLIISSRNDKHVNEKALEDIKRLEGFESIIYDKAGHNLEVDNDIERTIQILNEVMIKIKEMVED